MGKMNWVLILTLLSVMALSALPKAKGDKMIMCYFGSWSVYRYGTGKFDVEDIPPHLCTHLMFGFAGLDPATDRIRALDPYNELPASEVGGGRNAFGRFTDLKKYNPNLKTILAIGGWNEGSTAYSHMATTPARRATFIASCRDMVLRYGFDGLDLDWEYPGGRDDSPGLPEDKVNFALLLQEMRVEFDKYGLLMTAAVSAGRKYIDNGYNVPVMAETLDIISLMTYDYHGSWENHSFTGHNSPMRATPEEQNPANTLQHEFVEYNTEWSVQYWLSLGAKPEQLLLGMGAYGRGFRLASPVNNGLYAPAPGPITAGPYTGTPGFWGYNEYCEKMFIQGQHPNWNTVHDPDVVAPYAYDGTYWFGYDDVRSIEAKSRYILDHNLAGGMVWSIDTDDFQGFCGAETFPLIKTIDWVLNSYVPPTGDTVSTSMSTSPITPNSTPPPTSECDGSSGHKPVDGDCHAYYTCTVVDGEWQVIYGSCPSEQWFHPERDECVNPEMFPDICPGSTISTQSTQSTPTPAPGEKHCNDGARGYSYHDCSQNYWVCQAAGPPGEFVITDMTCPAGLTFNEVTQRCDFPSDVPECAALLAKQT